MNNPTQQTGTQPLPVNHELLWYTIEEVLGHGGFGTTYLATDTNLNRKVAIKEYLPSIFAYRGSDLTVTPLTEDHNENYNWGLTSFLNEARTLAQFKHRNVVQVQTVFEEYNTAYMVMEYEEGDPLDRVFKFRSDELDQPFFENLLFLVMDGLQAIHDAGFIHRDIKPGNLYIRADGSPVLIDFGSARQTSQQETSEMTTLVSQGYTPLEQYSPNFGDQGPWTDIYSLAASVYHGVAGTRPDDALNRSASLLSSNPDPLPKLTSLQKENYSAAFCRAIDSALELKPAERPQSLSEWKQAFQEQPDSTRNRQEPVTDKSAMSAHDIDDDVTRLHQPAHLSTNSSAPTVLNRSSPQSAPQTGQHRNIDQLDWDKPASENRTPRRESTPKEPTRVNHNEPKKASNLPLLIGSGVMVLALAAGGWWFSNQGNDTNNIFSVTKEMLETLPRPNTPHKLIVPHDQVATEIAELRVLATTYTELLELDSDSPQGKEGISYIIQNYNTIANLSVVKNSDSLRSKLSAAVQALTINTDTNGEAEKLATELNSQQPLLSFADIQPLLDQRTRTPEDNEQLIYSLSALNLTERSLAIADKRVIDLITLFKQSIVESVKNSEFDRASHMVSLALLIYPEHPELTLLRNHLEVI